MSEKPIIFSGPMVCAILAGTKTQTRRLLKAHMPLADFFEADGEDRGKLWWAAKQVPLAEPGDLYQFRCRYGVAGDKLWVRETFCPDWTDHVIYRADGGSAKSAGYASEPRWRPSIHMPRWASRITLRVTSVRVERLQDISDADVEGEGLPAGAWYRVPGGPRKWFQTLWDGLNAERAPWASNPWVWVIGFEREG